jgi:hypothetical protein
MLLRSWFTGSVGLILALAVSYRIIPIYIFISSLTLLLYYLEIFWHFSIVFEDLQNFQIISTQLAYLGFMQYFIQIYMYFYKFKVI